MTIRAPKKENMIALLLFIAIIMLKICALVALCAHNQHEASHHDDTHPHHKIKKYSKTSVQSNGQKYVM